MMNMPGMFTNPPGATTMAMPMSMPGYPGLPTQPGFFEAAPEDASSKGTAKRRRKDNSKGQGGKGNKVIVIYASVWSQVTVRSLV